MKKEQSKTDKANAELVSQVIQDFEQRKIARKLFELQWQLNIDFMKGNQNNYISKFETVVPMGKQYYWQEREVFNHIAPMIETRLAKLSDNRPVINIIPSTAEQIDIDCASVCKKIVNGVFQKVNMKALLELANMWSEMTGTVFYKVIWNNEAGRLVGEINGKLIYEGDVQIVVCSPFEIYPDSITAGDVGECRSIIHAKAYKTAEIARLWGVSVEGQDIDIFDLTSPSGVNKKAAKSVMSDAAVVIEKYEMPTAAYPNGRLLIVAGDKLLFKGELSYNNQSGGLKGLPFVRQCSEQVAGTFYGKSVIERAIPVQRAYNSVKNRKAEYLNRLACGVLSVEDGSIDFESLENDGIAPGKVLVYRQGTQAPKFMDAGELPQEFEREEERLLNEFSTITGGKNLARDGETGNLSAAALQILVEQDNKHMARTIAAALRSIETVAAHVLRLCKQFAAAGRLERVTDGKEVEMFYWHSAEITSDEVKAESAQDIADTPSARRIIILELLQAGLLYDESGKIPEKTRVKVLNMIGLGELAY